ncbi:tubulointerstitial nephritis antigen-like [Anaeramoeba flamelloides]|uniref:Tubulointerstitial nephritis antigen-like n=1 Tax=Anaeramoeba flamelloides TaxID=1746091 RepID=A0AAV8A2J4_9EUKA|nr:tubulointerstitial nephritis antigen-like [Anaeramoeba flamelloides]
MKIIICLFVIFGLIFADQQLIDEVNSKQNLWIAGQTKFSSWSQDEIVAMLGAKMKPGRTVRESEVVFDVPDSYDFDQDQAACKGEILDQGKCGSCWTFGTATSFTKRRCKLTQDYIAFSEQDLVSCDKDCDGCNGGFPFDACQWVEEHGLVKSSCYPYTSGNGNSGWCKSKCVDGEDWKTYKMKSGSCKSYVNENEIQNTIYQDGPVCGTMIVYEDFMKYTGGVYKHISGEMLGGHAITIIGWGEDNGTKYWKVQNSWGEKWGEDGYFRILRGTDECGIEAGADAGIPEI